MEIDGPDVLLRVLLDRDVVLRSSAVDGDVLVVTDPARGWFRILEKPRAQFFARRGGAAFARELALYEHESLRPVLPTLRFADRESALLLFETFPGGYDVVEFHRMGRVVAEWLPSLIGIALAAVHTSGVRENVFPRTLPEVLRGSDPSLSAPVIAQALGRVAAQWTGDALLHGDASFERIIVAPEPERRIQLVGWDEARLGDPAWDVGAVLESYYAWSLDPRIVSDVEGPVCPLPPYALMAAVMTFWSSYLGATRLAPAEGRARLVRAFGYAGVRLLARVGRMLRKPEPVTPQLTQMMQAGIALMTSPAVAADSFFAPAPPAAPQAWGTW